DAAHLRCAAALGALRGGGESCVRVPAFAPTGPFGSSLQQSFDARIEPFRTRLACRSERDSSRRINTPAAIVQPDVLSRSGRKSRDFPCQNRDHAPTLVLPRVRRL